MGRRPFVDVKTAEKPDPQSAEEKQFSLSALDIKRLCPFFYAAICMIPRFYTDQVPGIRVTADKIYINRRYIRSLSRAELTGVIIHELYHILMSHNVRGAGKDPVRWNRACDLYISKCMNETFGTVPGKGSVSLSMPDMVKTYIGLPEGMPFDAGISVEKDIPEKIYLRHEIEEPEHEFNASSGDAGGASGKNSSQGKKGEIGEGEGEDRGEAPGKTEESGDKADVGSRKQESSFADDEDNQDPLKMDISDDEDSINGQFHTGQNYEQLMRKIRDYYEKSLDAVCGRGTPYEEMALSFIEDRKPRKINWRKLIDKRLQSVRTDEKSLSYPDRRFAYKGIYIEGNVINDECLYGIKICVDTSASMADSDIAMSLKHIRMLLDQYDMKAELIYWDEEVEGVMPLENIRDFTRAGKFVKGRGGTSPQCLFDSFAGREKPLLILIFTDGHINPIDEKYARQYDMETVWILSGDHSVQAAKFHPGFGEVVRGDNAV